MSQHTFETRHHSNRPILIRAGWDRPLRGFFMTVEYTDDGKSDGETEFAYNNLDQAYPHPTTFEPFQMALDRVGLRVPAKMVREIRGDMIDNTGNKVVRWWYDVDRVLMRERVV